MKKLIGILSVFLGIGLIICFIAGFAGDVPFDVPKASSFAYKLMTGIQYFCRFLPAIAITGYIVTFSVHFGRNAEGSTSRFSKAMIDRFKTVMIVSVVVACVLTLFAEVFGMLAANKKSSIINRPKIINDYINVGNKLFDNGYYDRAMNYAEAALKLSPNEKRAIDLRDRTDVEQAML